MTASNERFRRLVAHDYDLIASSGAVLPTARLYDEAILGELPERCSLVVDVGCGTGELTAKLAHRAARVVGIDISAGAIRTARERNRSSAVDFKVAAVEELPAILGPDRCSAIIANRVLHHCGDMNGVVVDLVSLLEPEGKLVVLDLDSTGRGASWARRALVTILYYATLVFKGLLAGKPLQAVRDISAERRAYASLGWQQHLSHEPHYEWRDIRDALDGAGACFVRRRVNWKFHLFSSQLGTPLKDRSVTCRGS